VAPRRAGRLGVDQAFEFSAIEDDPTAVTAPIDGSPRCVRTGDIMP